MKQNLILPLVSTLMLGLLSACATHELVRPGSNGVHSVTTHADTGEATERSALSQANNFCQEVVKTKSAYVVTEKTAYKGSMSERNFRAAKTVSGAGLGIIGLGANVMAADGGYSTKLTFTCRQRLSARR